MLKLNVSEEVLLKLRKVAGGDSYSFLGLTLDLKESVIKDNFGEAARYFSDWHLQLLTTLLTHYATEQLVPLSGKQVKYRDLPGGSAYERAFIKRAVQPVAEAFGANPKQLAEAAALLGGKPLPLGDASVEIDALKGIPLTYIVWAAEDYPASASILYDESASRYLPTEDLAVLGEVATSRLLEAKRALGF